MGATPWTRIAPGRYEYRTPSGVLYRIQQQGSQKWALIRTGADPEYIGGRFWSLDDAKSYFATR